jgi:hypothetical protein
VTAPHLCHHPACDREVPPRLLACRSHWYALPTPLRDRIWATYRPGQEFDTSPSRAYLTAMDTCIRHWLREDGDRRAGSAPSTDRSAHAPGRIVHLTRQMELML